MKKTLMVLSLFLIVIGSLVGCSDKEPTPEERFAAYTKLWKSQDFTAMYKYLSTETKAKITLKEFIERHEKIYDGIEVDNLKITYKKTEETKAKKDVKSVSLPFSESMDTLAGSIEFEQSAKWVKEEKDEEVNWYIDWDTTYIFPELEEGEKVSVETYPAVRGEIVDRSERFLAENGTAMEVNIVPEEMTDKASIITQVAKLLNMTSDEIEKKLSQTWVQSNYNVPIKKLSTEQTDLLAKLSTIPSVNIKEVAERIYPYNEATAHLIGYVGEISAEELETYKEKGYTANDVIGKRGLEQVLEEKLKGEAGAKIYIMAENGEEKVIANKPAKEGETFTLTIDAELQSTIFAQYKNESGSAVALDPITGEALALVSSPSFDPNDFVLGMSSTKLKALEDDPAQPLLNRFSSIYAPGSTMKPLTASVALKNGVDPNEAIKISGTTWSKSNWKDHSITRVSDPGKAINMKDALVYSDNIYFAQKALGLGTKKFTTGMKSFGFEEKIPFEYPIQASTLGDIDSEGRLADSGYGQGQVQMSTLHAAVSYTAFVNKGNIITPTLIMDDTAEPNIWKENVISEDQADNLLTMLTEVVEDSAGSGHALSSLKTQIAGKTGTAELKQTKDSAGVENGWFVGVNTDNPELLMAWMMEGVENNGGSHHVVDLMKPVWEKYFKK